MGPTLAGGQVRAPLRGMASQDYEFETGLSPAGQVRVRMGPARAGVPPPASACLQARELLLARRELLTLDQAHNQRSKLLVRQRCKPQQAGVQPLQLAFRHRVGSTPPTRSSARGRCNKRRRISAARDRRPRARRKTRSISASLGGSRLRRVARSPRPPHHQLGCLGGNGRARQAAWMPRMMLARQREDVDVVALAEDEIGDGVLTHTTT